MTTQTTQTTATIDPTTRRVPPRGGFSPTVVRIELRRMLRNRRTLFFALLFPAALFLAFGSTSDSGDGDIAHGNVSAYVMVSMALYGAALTAAAGGTQVALERSTGWSRQLRLTPLKPAVYIAIKALMALLLGVLAIVAVNLVGLVQGKPDMSAGTWLACALVTVPCTLVFAALGLFVGYLVPGENAMQVLGPGLALLSFLGNVFIPIDDGTTLHTISSLTPMFGVAEIARSPLTGDLGVGAVVNAVGYLVVFVVLAAWRMSRDTARV